MPAPIHIALHMLTAEEWQQMEWLVTNGAGGWASSTLLCCNTRRYHGYLIVAQFPPLQRYNMVADMEEEWFTPYGQYFLSYHDYGDTLYPTPHQGLAIFFDYNLYPEWQFHVHDLILMKSLITLQGSPTTIVRYSLLKGNSPIKLCIRPLVAARHYHHLQQAVAPIQQDILPYPNYVEMHPFPNLPPLRIGLTGGEFQPNCCWYYHFHYARETERGLDDREDLFSYGYWHITLQPEQSCYLVLTTTNYPQNPEQAFFDEIQRRKESASAKNSFPTLTCAAQDFLIGQNDAPTILAGYPWFTEWGRDTLISINGLCTYRQLPHITSQILKRYASLLSAGMLPNFFPDGVSEPQYNTVDASLWFFIALYHLHKHYPNKDFLKNMLPALQEIITHYRKGTRYQIHEDDDHLLFAGEPGVQLTWMDARVNGQVITPRIGKPVEVNALWYQAKRLYGNWLQELGYNQDANQILADAAATQESFAQAFWNAEHQCLYDVLTPNGPDAAIRPNQLWAIGLPYSLIPEDQALQIMEVVRKHLYTHKGLRSLSPTDPAYQHHYLGPPTQRDLGYHQGTVWLYLVGVYVDAIMRYHPYGKQEATLIINRLLATLAEQGLLTLGEIADGDSPHSPRGCIAQAWSVGECIRVIQQYQLPVYHSFA
ncbi:MAG: amylo-alpha-1,6-glucosidase [Thermoflavifilum sp.]|nr:amylo-alpha-1,6-glucosidase [Thermoflavifilum sp.]